jgi:hypothetical protein
MKLEEIATIAKMPAERRGRVKIWESFGTNL